MARVLGACRESGRGEESVSIKNQQDRINAWAVEHGHEVVQITIDRATTGDIPAARRAVLGPWLTDPAKIATWDILVATKLDRGWRNSADFTDLLARANDRTDPMYGKKLVSITEAIDLATPEGALMGTVFVSFAQFERQRAGQRRREAAEIIRDQGRWNGGRVPFGYAVVGSKGNYRLAPDAETGPIVQQMVADAIAGKSLAGIAADLNGHGITTSLGRQWRNTTVHHVVTSPAMLGHVVQMKGKVPTTRRDSHGQPIKFTEDPLIGEDEWHQLQAVLRARSRHRGLAQARQMLYRVAFCGMCSEYDKDDSPRDGDAILYGHTSHTEPRRAGFYNCSRGCGFYVRQEVIEGLIEELVIHGVGQYPLTEQRLIPGDDHGAEISRLEAQAERRRDLLADDPDDSDLAHSLARLEAKLADLHAAPHQPEVIERVPAASGETVKEHWAGLDPYERGQWLRDWGAVAYASRRCLTLRIPEDPSSPDPASPVTVIASWKRPERDPDYPCLADIPSDGPTLLMQQRAVQRRLRGTPAQAHWTQADIVHPPPAFT